MKGIKSDQKGAISCTCWCCNYACKSLLYIFATQGTSDLTHRFVCVDFLWVFYTSGLTKKTLSNHFIPIKSNLCAVSAAFLFRDEDVLTSIDSGLPSNTEKSWIWCLIYPNIVPIMFPVTRMFPILSCSFMLFVSLISVSFFLAG